MAYLVLLSVFPTCPEGQLVQEACPSGMLTCLEVGSHGLPCAPVSVPDLPSRPARPGGLSVLGVFFKLKKGQGDVSGPGC